MFGVKRLRVPDELKAAVCFLCVEKAGKVLYGGTAFFTILRSKRFPALSFTYLVTARHCVERAYRKYGHLKARVNLASSNGADTIDLPNKWMFPGDPNVNVAVLNLNIGRPFDVMCLKSEYFATDAKIEEFGVGIGDETTLIGLFTQRQGRKLNIPIVRSGIIAAMPEELLFDDSTGGEYHAYLIEARSIGGLSGSPVFANIPPKRSLGFNRLRPEEGYSLALGLMRGHYEWGASTDRALKDFLNEGPLNSGIAIVTPIQEVSKIILENRVFQETREEMEQSIKDGTGFVEWA